MDLKETDLTFIQFWFYTFLNVTAFLHRGREQEELHLRKINIELTQPFYGLYFCKSANSSKAATGPSYFPEQCILYTAFYIYLRIAALDFRYCLGFSVVAASEGCSLVVVHGLLTAMASLADPGLQVHRLHSVAVAPGL